jgi:arginase
VEVVDYGDVAVAEGRPERNSVTGIIAPAALAHMVITVQAAVQTVLHDGAVPLVIGGECPLLLGCLAASRAARGRIGLLFVDGHEDAWPPSASTTGEAADMELGFALGLTQPRGIETLTSLLPLVGAEDVVVLGPRDRDDLVRSQIPLVGSEVVFRDDGLLRRDLQQGEIVRLLDQLRSGTPNWWFHLDLDVLATGALAAVRYPQPGGLQWDELSALTATALQTPGLVGWDVTIYNPDLDPDGAGAERIVDFMAKSAHRLDGRRQRPWS